MHPNLTFNYTFFIVYDVSIIYSNDNTSERLLYREAQRIRRKVSSVWIPRAYGDPIFKTPEAMEINQALKVREN